VSGDGNPRRAGVPFDPYYFEKRRGDEQSTEERFTSIYRTKHWGGAEPASGAGAAEEQTLAIGAAIPAMLRELGALTLLDVPCGDFSWMARVDLGGIHYIGGDIVREIVDANRSRFTSPQRTFLHIDLLRGPLPAADVLLCRDCLVHFSNDDIARAFDVIRASGVRYLLTTTFPDCDVNEEIVTGDWRIINLERPPFSLPPPLRLVNEGCTEAGGRYADKSLGLWEIS
jgi:SAM-dependent methyltransferase